MFCDRAVAEQFLKLSDKHRMVLDLVADNLTTKEIARQLSISPHTVEQRIQTIRSKFGAVPRRELRRIHSELSAELTKGPGSPEPPAMQLSRTLQDPGKAGSWPVLHLAAGFLAGLFSGIAIALVAFLAAFHLAS